MLTFTYENVIVGGCPLCGNELTMPYGHSAYCETCTADFEVEESNPQGPRDIALKFTNFDDPNCAAKMLRSAYVDH